MFKQSIFTLLILLLCAMTVNAPAQEMPKLLPHDKLPEPQYDSNKARVWVDKMLKAHGKTAPWQKGDTFSFNHSLYILNFPAHLNPWWISHEQFQQDERRGYHYYPMEDALLVFKNGSTFHQNWQMPNPPGLMPFFNYSFIATPWLALQNGAVISYTGKRQLVTQQKPFETVKLQFTKGATDTPDNYLRLFIEPDSGRLKGIEYNSTYAPMLDQMDIKGHQFGPGFHVYDSYQEVDGLLFVERYSTYFNENLAGVHAVTNLSMQRPFNEALSHRDGDFHLVTDHPTIRKLKLTKQGE